MAPYEERTTTDWWTAVRAGASRLRRRTLGAIVAAVGVLVSVVSAYLPWYGDGSARRLAITHLVQADAGGDAASFWRSVAAPLAVLGMIGALGAAVRSRLLLGLAWLTGVVTVVLWSLMRAIDGATGEASASGPARFGVWVCVVGLAVLLAGVAMMGPRREEFDAPLSMFDDDQQP